jgi:hypothetical protein
MIAAVPERTSDRRNGCLRSTAWQAYNNLAWEWFVFSFIASTRARTIPRSGSDRDSRASRIVTRILKTLPASTGLANKLRRRPRTVTCHV